MSFYKFTNTDDGVCAIEQLWKKDGLKSTTWRAKMGMDTLGIIEEKTGNLFIYSISEERFVDLKRIQGI